MDDSFQPTIDMLLNVAVFAWFGAVCPWSLFNNSPVIPIWRLIILAVLVLLFRRPPIVYLMHRFIPQIEQKRQALFVGFFGPIGVSAVFYIHVSAEYLSNVVDPATGSQREDARQLAEVIEVVVWFMVICSIVVHGLSIPLAKLGLYIPRTLSRATSESPEPGSRSPNATSFRMPAGAVAASSMLRDRRGKRENAEGNGAVKGVDKFDISRPQGLFRIGRPVGVKDGEVGEGGPSTLSPAATTASSATVAENGAAGTER